MRVTIADYLLHCADWSAPFEVAQRIKPDYTRKELFQIERGLRSMKNLGAAEYHAGNNTYRCFMPKEGGV